MPTWLSTFLLNFILSHVLTDLQKSEEKIDWAALKVKIEEDISKWPFGSFVDSTITEFIDNCLGIAQTLLSGPLQQTLMPLLLAGKFADALIAFKTALASAVLPHAITAEGLEALALKSIQKQPS